GSSLCHSCDYGDANNRQLEGAHHHDTGNSVDELFGTSSRIHHSHRTHCTESNRTGLLQSTRPGTYGIVPAGLYRCDLVRLGDEVVDQGERTQLPHHGTTHLPRAEMVERWSDDCGEDQGFCI